MAAPSVAPTFIFGLRTDIHNNVQYLEDNVVVYPAGHGLVFFNLDTRTQRFIHGEKGDGGDVHVTAFAVSPNKKYVAMAESGEHATVSIYDARTLKKRKILVNNSSLVKRYISMCFSADNKNLVTLSAGPDHTLTNWLWEMVKPMESVGIKLSREEKLLDLNKDLQCHISPGADSVVLVAGNRVAKTYKVDGASNSFVEDPLKLGEIALARYSAQAWIDAQRLLLATYDGQVALIKGGSVQELVVPNTGEKGLYVSAFKMFSRGFIAGLSDGTVRVYENTDKAGAYKCTRTLVPEKPKHRVPVVTIDISASEDDLLVTNSGAQLLLFKMFDSDVTKAGERKFESLVTSFHQGSITGIDTCPRKPLVVTCGEDKTVRVWNYITKRVEIEQTFNETPLSVAVHPSGFHMIVGFQDKLRLMNILMDNLAPFKELPIKSCGECQFSNGGQMFAAVMGTVILVYNFYSGDLLYTIRMHNGLVRSIFWNLDDTAIVTAGMDGAVYERVLGEGHRHQEWVQKSCHYTSALVTADGKIFAVGDDRYLKEIVNSTVNRELDAGVVLTQIVVSHPPQRMLFVGTETGFVRSFKFPLTGESYDAVCHNGPVTRMKLSYDDTILFTVSTDGCLAFFEVQEKEARLAKRERADAVPFTEEILVTKSDLEEKNAIMSDLKTQVDELTVHNAYQLRLHDITYQDKLKEVTEKFNLQLEHDRSKYEMLKDEKQDLELEFEEKLKHVEDSNARALHELDLEHQQKIMDQVKKYRELEQTMENEAAAAEEAGRKRETVHQRQLQDVRDKYAAILQHEKTLSDRVQSDKNLVLRKFEETKSQLEQDTDKEIEELKAKFEAKLHQERDATLRLKGENGIMKKKFSALKKDIEDQKEEIKTMAEKEQQLYQHIQELEREILRHKSEIDERDVTIGDRETEIYDLKKDNQELEKFKFVLDYQIKELKRQIEPRENELEQMKDQVLDMDGQLESCHRDNGGMDENVKQLHAELNAKQDAIKAQREKLRMQESKLEKLKNDLEATMKYIQNPMQLQVAAEQLIREHQIQPLGQAEVDPEVAQEYQRHKNYLETSVAELKKKLHKEGKTRKHDNMRIIQENVALIKEINELRKELKLLRMNRRQANETKLQQGSETSRTRTVFTEQESRKIVEMQKIQIETLREQIHAARQQA